MKEVALVISCEHAVNTVPELYKTLFTPHQQLLETHQGIDLGAHAISDFLSQQFNCDFIAAETTRLLIDCNRSLTHRQCFSAITRLLPLEEKKRLIEHYYLPYRQRVKNFINQCLEKQKLVLHLSIHSFTPSLDNQIRNADIGLLYDPKRMNESTIAKLWQRELKQLTGFRVRRNYPYLGISDGLITALRKEFEDQQYAGIEVEVNQGLLANPQVLLELSTALAYTLKKVIPSSRSGTHASVSE